MTSGDKYLDRAGLHKVLKSVGESYYTEQMLDDLFEIADLSKNGLISLEVSFAVKRKQDNHVIVN